MTAAIASEREIVQTRTFDAPPHLVWRAWTERDLLIKWFGPAGFTNTFDEFDPSVGGVWRFTMHAPNGVDYPNYVVFRVLEPHSRIEYDHGAGPGDPETFSVTITLLDVNGKTELTQRSLLPTVEQFERVKSFGAVELGGQTLDKLADLLRSL